MAQRTQKEENFVPETLTLCVNNCGVIGNPATNNMCQKCFNATSTTSFSASSTPSFSDRSTRRLRSPVRSSDPVEFSRNLNRTIEEKETVAVVKKEVSRCSGCRKKVGLSGFRCRCGDLFCSEHRYSDRHDCSYDYKAAGREAIARDNPVVKAAKIVRI